MKLEKLKKRIQEIKKKRPGYTEILDFYLKVREAQDKAKASVRIEPISFNKEWKDLLAKEGFPILDRSDLRVDTQSSTELFRTLCRIGREANPHLSGKIGKIEEAIEQGKLDLKSLFEDPLNEEVSKKIARRVGVERKILLFLLQSSLRPSIEAAKEQVLKEIDSEKWLKGICPVCGSFPFLGLLKEDVGKRFLLCSYCGYEWRVERFFCPFCRNQDQGSLRYFHAEGEEAYRIDLCDKCHRYIKTIDLRKLEASDPILEDIATLHLDFLAAKKRYKRPAPTPWTA